MKLSILILLSLVLARSCFKLSENTKATKSIGKAAFSLRGRALSSRRRYQGLSERHNAHIKKYLSQLAGKILGTLWSFTKSLSNKFMIGFKNLTGKSTDYIKRKSDALKKWVKRYEHHGYNGYTKCTPLRCRKTDFKCVVREMLCIKNKIRYKARQYKNLSRAIKKEKIKKFIKEMIGWYALQELIDYILEILDDEC